MSKTSRKRSVGAQGRKVIPTHMVTTSRAPWDFGAKGQANQAGLIVEDAPTIDTVTGRRLNPNGVKRARRVDMLEVWHRAGKISTQALNAAEKLRDAFEATQRAPGWPDNDRVQSSPKPDHAVTIQIDRLARYEVIMRLVPTADRPIIDACVLSRGGPGDVRLGGGSRPYLNTKDDTTRHEAGLKALSAALVRLAVAMG